tara:strand:- start:9780 stop:10256 length:477 start_codon:yes stop_codon:yes gene_type:complete
MKKTITLRVLTDNSWLAWHGDNRQALVVQTAEQLLWVTTQGAQEFQDQEHLQKTLNIELEVLELQETLEIAQDLQKVQGFPVKHWPVFNINTEPYVTYTKSATSKVSYAAGYWAFLFAAGWTGSWCPKLQTLQDYQHIGPFTSKLEMQTAINGKNRES